MNSKRIPLCSFLGETLNLYYFSTFLYSCSAIDCFLITSLFFCSDTLVSEMIHLFAFRKVNLPWK